MKLLMKFTLCLLWIGCLHTCYSEPTPEDIERFRMESEKNADMMQERMRQDFEPASVPVDRKNEK